MSFTSPLSLMNSPRDGRRALTLLEVMMAAGILSIVVIGIIGAGLFVTRATQQSRMRMTAYSYANSIIEELRGLPYRQVGRNEGLAANYLGPLDYQPVLAGEVSRTTYVATIDYTGFGRVTSWSSTSLTDSNANWTPNEWVGQLVMTVTGTGSGQVARITSNTSNTLNLNFDIGTGVSDGQWRLPLGTDTEYEINHGKTIRINVSWQVNGRTFNVQRTAFIHRRSTSSN